MEIMTKKQVQQEMKYLIEDLRNEMNKKLDKVKVRIVDLERIMKDRIKRRKNE
jgi:predicted acetyltransferase